MPACCHNIHLSPKHALWQAKLGPDVHFSYPQMLHNSQIKDLILSFSHFHWIDCNEFFFFFFTLIWLAMTKSYATKNGNKKGKLIMWLTKTPQTSWGTCKISDVGKCITSLLLLFTETKISTLNRWTRQWSILECYRTNQI